MSYPDGTSCSYVETYRGYDILSCGPGTWPYEPHGYTTYTVPALFGIYSFMPSLTRARESIDEELGETVATTITLDVQPMASPGEIFTISGYLTETVSGLPLSGKTISILLDGAPWFTRTTDVNGFYGASKWIDVPGTYTIEAVFSG